MSVLHKKNNEDVFEIKKLNEENIELKNKIDALKESSKNHETQMTELENQNAEFSKLIKNLKNEIDGYKLAVGFVFL